VDVEMLEAMLFDPAPKQQGFREIEEPETALAEGEIGECADGMKTTDERTRLLQDGPK
jgi:hypothetical protein